MGTIYIDVDTNNGDSTVGPQGIDLGQGSSSQDN
jgi:hypothetical protein